MNINTMLEKVEQFAKIKGIDLKSSLAKEFVQFWCDHEVKEALENGEYGYVYSLTLFNDWVQKY